MFVKKLPSSVGYVRVLAELPCTWDTPPTDSLARRCLIHADKMDGEGWYTTANVLRVAADRILELERATVPLGAGSKSRPVDSRR